MLAVDITVSPFDHQQEYIGGGAGFTLYSGHLTTGVPSAQRQEVYDWLFKDLNLPDLRIFSFRGEEFGNDNSDPFDLDLNAMNIPTRDTEFEIYQEAIARNPNSRVMAYTNTHPDFLKNPDGSYNTSLPNFYEELAEYWYGNLVITKQRYGVEIDILDVLNEPDFKSELNLSLSTEFLANTVTALENLVTLHYATYGVEMPIISGFSTGTAASGNNWLSGLENNNQQAWDNLDILATHPYGGGGSGFVQSNYEGIADLKDADHPHFIQNEMEFGHSSFLNNSNALPDDLADDELEAALALARIFAMSIEAGADGFHVFQGNNPSGSGGKSLVRTPWGQTAERRTGYYVFQQMTSLQPMGSDVVADVTTGAPAGVHTLAFNKWGDNQVFVNVVNATGSADTAAIQFEDNNGVSLGFQHVRQLSTSGTENSAVVVDQNVASGTTVWNATIPANSVQTFVITLNTTGYAIPVGDLTYIRETSGSSFNTTPQDGDTNPRTEYLIGLNGNGSAGSQRGEMRALMEFDLSNLGLSAGSTISSARLEMLGYRGSVGSGEAIAFEAYEYGGDFVEAQATWVDPDGDGNTATGDTVAGGTLGSFLGGSSTFDGDVFDYNDGGSTEIFHERVIVGGNGSFTTSADNALGGDLRLLVRPDMAVTTNSEFFGFFDEESIYAPELIVTVDQLDFDGPTVAQTTFNSETNQSFDFTFSEPIDTSTLQVDDFVFESFTTGQVLSGSSNLFLINVTSTSSTIIFRELPIPDGNWELRMNNGAFSDIVGNASQPLSFEFSVLSGDADSDGDVDGRDFLAWQRGFGTNSPNGTTSQGDADADLDVDAIDLIRWHNNYGQSTVVASAAVAPVSAAITAPTFDVSSNVEGVIQADTVLAEEYGSNMETNEGPTDLIMAWLGQSRRSVGNDFSVDAAPKTDMKTDFDEYLRYRKIDPLQSPNEASRSSENLDKAVWEEFGRSKRESRVELKGQLIEMIDLL